MPTINLPPKAKRPAQSNNGNREKRKKFYNSKAWLVVRSEKLRTDPLCEMCLNGTCERITPATQVHHIISFLQSNDPVEQNKLFIDPENLMSICADCHGKLSAKEQHNKTK